MAEGGHEHKKTGEHSGGKHNQWFEKMKPFLAAGIIGISFAMLMPPLVSCWASVWGLKIPAYMAGMIGGASGVTAAGIAYSGFNEKSHAKKAGGGGHH